MRGNIGNMMKQAQMVQENMKLMQEKLAAIAGQIVLPMAWRNGAALTTQGRKPSRARGFGGGGFQ